MRAIGVALLAARFVPTSGESQADKHLAVNAVVVRRLFRSTVRAEGLVGLRPDAGLDIDLTDFKVVPIL